MAFAINSCIVVEYIQETINSPAEYKISPKPEIPMSDQLIRSEKGDMIAYLPKDWSFLNVEESASSDIIAIAVNNEYTLSAVFVEIRKNEKLDNLYLTENLLGIAKSSIEKKIQKSNGLVGMVGKFQTIDHGEQKYIKYETSTDAGVIRSSNVVFRSSNGNYYEFGLVPMNINGKTLPADEEYKKIFNSIVASIKY
jgi:hypothetical protein